ncbi:hypothetical protein BYT27DRAFT_7233998 [Phlegmacium glaucopus]|nr:hypothetical protein BYT27DRAFT_7233998 [Phlegmacium glaucopus]
MTRSKRGSGKLALDLNITDGNATSRSKRPIPDKTLVVTEQMMDAERARLLGERQELLTKVTKRHDTLVRELFHMENFTMMLGYNPEEAKEDNTNVFREYKSRYDLIDKAVPTAGPSRQTRKAHSERRQMLTSASVSAPLPPLPSKRKPKPKAPNTAAIWDSLASARGDKGKGKEREQETEEEKELEREKKAEKEKENANEMDLNGKEVSLPIDPIALGAQIKPTSPHQVTSILSQRGKKETRISTTISENREKQAKFAPLSINGHTPCPPTSLLDEPISASLSRRSKRLKEPDARKPPPEPVKVKKPPLPNLGSLQTPQTPLLTAPPSPPKSNVKRVRLIVRRPPLTLTNPRQRPRLPKFNWSLNSLLSSYTCLGEDEPDLALATLERDAGVEAEILERVAQFRRDGRFLPGTQTLFGTKRDDSEYHPPQRTSTDVWDDVLKAVVVKARLRPKKSLGKQIASQIANKIQTHFDNQEARKIKAKEAEERRVRNLAKSTMKLVVGEWKKAIFHIREKHRLELEAEELKRGHAHLDAILDQSGQILETQHGDLSRGDLYGSSRGSSVENLGLDEEEENENEGDGDEDEETEDEDEDEGIDDARSIDALTGDVSMRGSEDEDEGEGDEEDDDEKEDENEDDAVDSVMLLGGLSRRHASPTSRSATPDTTTFSLPVQEDIEESVSPHMLGSLADEDMIMHSPSSPSPSFADLIPDPESSPQRLHININQLSTNHEVANSESISRNSSDDKLEEDTSHASQSAGRHVAFDSQSQLDELPDNLPDLEEERSLVETVGLASVDNLDVTPSKSPDNDLEDPTETVDDTQANEEDFEDMEQDIEAQIPDYLKPYAVAPVDWDLNSKVTPPLLLRGVLRPYQQSGLEWLVSLHVNKLNGILADEMGLGKTIQTIALLAHLACDRGIWGPHLIVVPTSVLLNWEMEFKKFLPGFRILSYHGSTKRRKELRQGWNDKHHFNVCITSYTLASKDAHIFKRKAWYYMILDEAHMIKNFKSQRWNILLMFRSYRRLLLTGTPLQNNLTELWALLQFLMSGANFANLKEFGEWFSNPLEKAIEMGNVLDDETMQRVSKLHTVLRPYLLRRLKRDVEKELPSKYEHLILCPLSKRQRFLYDEFMSRAQTRDALESGVYQKIANILMQLRKVCNHPDLFEVRPIVTSFAMQRSAIADFEIKELLIRRRLLSENQENVNLDLVGLQFIDRQDVSLLTAVETRRLDGTTNLPYFSDVPGEPPPKDTRTIEGFRKYSAYVQRANAIARWAHIAYLNKLRCAHIPIYSEECLSVVIRMSQPIVPFSDLDCRLAYMESVDRVNQAVKSYKTRANDMSKLVDRFAFVTPPVVALDMPRIALSGYEDAIVSQPANFDDLLHPASVKLQIAFPDPLLLQYDCGKLQRLADLLREKKAGGHRFLIFTQMTRILDILEIFLNFHGYLYLRLDGATKIEDRQYITERFNADPRIFCFISSSRSGGVGINLTGADTVVFYDSDFNPQMDRQCEDRAHRIGQIRDVHIYRFVSQHTVEEAMLRKANQKRSLDDLVIQKGEFDWRSLFNDESALTKALGDFEDAEDRHAAAVAAREEISLVGADEDDFGGGEAPENGHAISGSATPADVTAMLDEDLATAEAGGVDDEDQEEAGGTVVDYMLAFVEDDYDFFRDWRL